MAKAKVKLICQTCGKEFTWSKEYASRSDANNAEEWASSNITECPECYNKEIIEIKNNKAERVTEELSLPELSGSEKQIKWANSIRVEFVEYYNKYILYSAKKQNIEKREIFEKLIKSQTVAKFWIDNRHSGFDSLIEKQSFQVKYDSIIDSEDYINILKNAKTYNNESTMIARKNFVIYSLIFNIFSIDELQKIVRERTESSFWNYISKKYYKNDYKIKKDEIIQNINKINSKLNEVKKLYIPEIIKGYRWNGTIYGKEGNYSIYLDGNKKSISSKEATELQQYQKDEDEYNRQISTILNN